MINKVKAKTSTGEVITGDLLTIKDTDMVYDVETKTPVKVQLNTIRQVTDTLLNNEYLVVGDIIGNDYIQGEVTMFLLNTYIMIVEDDKLVSYPFNDFIGIAGENPVRMIRRIYEDEEAY